ncbi:hypothetical protein M9H77_27352 [Catharanthus roseus]|uniref:Uncharacterized protein n=1 Tax=Catharanthus roseus TaxID=4058 RepID=A0ACC0AEE2_CATRO|nr:hypothetical protein M9H77_27352 [Catharanthus roseus]
MVRPRTRKSDDGLGPVTRPIPLNKVSGPGLQLGAQFFKQLVASVPVDSSYIGADYGATDCGNPSSDARLGRDFSTSGDGDRTRSEEPVMVGFLRIHGGEDDEDDGGDDDDDDDGDSHGDDDEPLPVAHASSSSCRPASERGKVAIKRPKKSRPPTNPTQKKKVKNDGWEQTGPANGGPQDLVLIPSYIGHTIGSVWRGPKRCILKLHSRFVSLTAWIPIDPTVVELARETGLSHLRSCMFQHLNSSLLSTFVER